MIDFEDLGKQNFSFLKESLKNKQFVLIGESAHGVKEFGEFKMKAVSYLVDSLGFSTILIESGFSDLLKWKTNAQANNDSLIYSLFPIWHTESYLKLFQHLNNKQVNIYGIDPQNSSRFFRDFPFEQLLKIDKKLASVFYEIDKEWSKAYSQPMTSWDSSFYKIQKNAIAVYDKALKEVSVGTNLDSKNQLLLKRILENRLKMAKNVDKNVDMFHRDSIMKENIDWLLMNVLSKDEKVIILSHNTHLAKESSFHIGYLGELMDKSYSKKIFVIGQYFASGNFADNKREHLKMKEPERNSFEYYLSQFKSAYQIFSLYNRELPKNIFDKKINTYYMGGVIQNLNLSQNYDMIFSVKSAHPPIFVD